MAILIELLILFYWIITSAVALPMSFSLPPSIQPSQLDPSLFATVLSSLGFVQLSNVVANLTSAPPFTSSTATTPLTIFAATDSSLLTCPSCSIPLLLQEHSVPGLYPVRFLRTLAFGTKLETLAPNRCLTITASTNPSQFSNRKVFVNGAEITRPDLFNNGVFIVHGVQGFVTHLSPLSCNLERMTSLSFPPYDVNVIGSPPAFSIMRLMLRDAMLRLRISGYSIVALALRVKYAELTELSAMTLFALDDASIFASGSHHYVPHFMLHVIPRRLMASELMSLPAAAILPSMESGEKLVVTTADGPLSMRINYVRVTTLDLMQNSRIAIHAISTPFRRVQLPVHTAEQSGACDQFDHSGSAGICGIEAPVPAVMRSQLVDDGFI